MVAAVGCTGWLLSAKVRWNQCSSFGSQLRARGSSELAAAEVVSSSSRGSRDDSRACVCVCDQPARGVVVLMMCVFGEGRGGREVVKGAGCEAQD